MAAVAFEFFLLLQSQIIQDGLSKLWLDAWIGRDRRCAEILWGALNTKVMV